MSWLRLNRRSAVLVAATLLLPLALYLAFLGELLGAGADLARQRDRLEPRTARLQGLLDRQDTVLQARDAAVQALRERVYPASDDASALAASLQTRLRQLFADAGMRVSNSQVLPPRDGEQFQEVPVKLTVDGSLAALDAALSAIAQVRPRVLVESFDAYPARQRRDAQALTVVVQLLALREVTP